MSAAQDFHPLTVTRVAKDTADAVRVALAVPARLRETFRFLPGQHVTMRAHIDGGEARRSYSICSGPDDDGLTLTIKRVEAGQVSTWANATLAAGDVVDVMPPAGRFVLPAPDGTRRTYLAIVAGSGITPVISMIRHVMAKEPEARFVLIYGNRTTASILYREALDDLKDRALGRLTVVHVLSGGEEADVPLLSGRIDGEKIAALLPKLVPITAISHAVLCGPDTLIKTGMKTLQALGVPRERIGFEFFIRGERRDPASTTPRPAPVAASALAGTELVAVLDGSRRTVVMRADETVLDAALRAGVNAPYSCRGGMCCTCRAKLVEGEAALDQNFSLEAWEADQGFILTCQARPKSARLIVDYDQV
jgi:ring-1,2-phenylacetyl-CoA epoxidase subunit PaaE